MGLTDCLPTGLTWRYLVVMLMYADAETINLTLKRLKSGLLLYPY